MLDEESQEVTSEILSPIVKRFSLEVSVDGEGCLEQTPRELWELEDSLAYWYLEK